MHDTGKVFDMDNTNFQLFVKVLETMENEDINHSDLESTIIKIIDKFDDIFTEEQKSIILREFVKYENARKEKQKKKKINDEDEQYQQMLDQFLKSQVDFE